METCCNINQCKSILLTLRLIRIEEDHKGKDLSVQLNFLNALVHDPLVKPHIYSDHNRTLSGS